VPADWSGDGTADTAVWRPNAGQWWLPGRTVRWGEPGDIPVSSCWPARSALSDGAIVRERSSPDVYALFDGRRLLIPTADALFAMGHDWASVQVVPDGSLALVPEVRIPSLSPTPGSLVFPPPNDARPPHYGRHFVIAGVKGAIRAVSQRRELAVLELRGWLHPVQEKTNVEPSWDDYHYMLELDSTWTAEQGIDLNQVLKVGNILEYSMDAAGPDAYRQIANPRIGIEINGRKPGNDLGLAQLADWRFPQDGTAAGREFLDTIGLPDTRWPFDPRFPVGDDARPYARVSGSLVADKDHQMSWVKAAERAWLAGMPHEEGGTPTRATAIHPPDLSRSCPTAPATRRCAAWRSSPGRGCSSPPSRSWTRGSPRPAPRPSPEHGIAVVELVGPETDLSTIVGGNETLTGAFLQASSRSPPAPVAADAVEFVLEAGPGITWRKVLSIADGRGGMWDVVTQDQ
jgi:hypothetical protein